MRFPAAVLLLFAFAACGRDRAIASGSEVRMHYRLKVAGEVVASSVEGAPLEFTQGTGEILAGLDEAILGLKAGEEKTLVLPPEKAHGPRDPKLIQVVPRKRFGPEMNIAKGMKIEGFMNGETAAGYVMAVASTGVTLDFNHPRAGQTLHFRVRILSVR